MILTAYVICSILIVLAFVFFFVDYDFVNGDRREGFEEFVRF